MSIKKRLIRLPGVLDKTGQGKSKIYKDIQKGEFPAPVRLGSRNVAWIEEEVDLWIDERPRVEIL